MRRERAMTWIIALGLSWCWTAVSAEESEELAGRSQPTAEQVRFFETAIRPLLANHCYECHGPDAAESELRLDTYAGILSGGNAGPAVTPGRPQGSLLLTAVSYDDSDLRMPPDEKLSERQIADLTRWIEQGAPHPDQGAGVARGTDREDDFAAAGDHWAFQPPRKPPVPEVKMPAGTPGTISSENPIDAFILAALQRRGLLPLGPADKRTLIRRATFDLTGLPPTPEEVEDFLADTSADAFRRLVDRLLESPHYGERWGRHWLDVARYADSNGLDENVAHGNAWRYRDYVVQSFNDDKPYDEFITEQLAGDLLESTSCLATRGERLIATGFLALGPKVLAEVDEAKMEMDIVDEQLDTIGRSLMGLTLGCARCHDHKFDPILQQDYYALAGIFKSTRTMETFKKVARWQENVIASPEQVAAKEAHERRIEQKKQQIEARVASAKQQLEPSDGETASKDIEEDFPADVQAELSKLRGELKQLEESLPVLPTAMGVVEGTVADTAVHIRGSHLTLGDIVPRRFPRIFFDGEPPRLPEDRSGRLRLAQWLTDGNHPLTARVMVNRLWRWHFGEGLVSTVDNFGLQGAEPTHPELLDWLAVRFVEEGWSIKALHRMIMLSNTYRRSSRFDAARAEVDAENRFYWRFPVRRLEAEAIRDALLAVSGTLDRTVGGSLLQTENREYLFNHTSEDKSTYEDIRRRSLYVPIVRNHLYDLFQLFDYTDASVLNGDRNVSTIAPQALLLMNSEFVAKLTAAMADRLLSVEQTQETRIRRLFMLAYGRPPTTEERDRTAEFIAEFQRLSGPPTDGEESARDAWQAVCQSLVSSSEFVYVR